MAEVARVRAETNCSSSSGSWPPARPGPPRRSPSGLGSGDRHRRSADRARARRADLLLLRARGRGRVPAPGGAARGRSARRPRGQVGGVIGRRPRRRRDRERARARGARAACPVWCDVDEETAWERAEGSGGPSPSIARSSRAGSPSAAALRGRRAGDPPASAREAGEAAAPWLAAHARRVPDVSGWSGPSRRPGPTRRSSVRARSACSIAARGTPPRLCRPGPSALPTRPSLRSRRPASRREATIEVEGGESRRPSPRPSACSGSWPRPAPGDDCVLAFGGGVVGDLAGFCAATYQRGVPLVQAPTTLVAQVDSAYGGKTGVDLPGGEELRGRLPPADRGLADPATLATLPPEELAAGFVEVVKTALIAGGPLWERVRGLGATRSGTRSADVIFDCARTKIAVVADDERDAGRRAVLNLGHTVGHAIEAATGYGRYRHGEAVGTRTARGPAPLGGRGLRDEVARLLAAHGLPTSTRASRSRACSRRSARQEADQRGARLRPARAARRAALGRAGRAG